MKYFTTFSFPYSSLRLAISFIPFLTIATLLFCQEPNIYETGQLGHFESKQTGAFGGEIDIDGDFMVTSDYLNNKVYVFKKVNTQWIKFQDLRPNDEENTNNFGNVVSISGNYIVVGADDDQDNGFASGAIYIFKLSNNRWEQVDKILGTHVYSRFGFGLDIHGDFIVVNTFTGDDIPFENKVYIYRLVNEQWTPFQELAINGRYTSISNNFLVVTSYTDQNEGIHIYDWDGQQWKEQSLLLPPSSSNTDFGLRVAIEGNKIITSTTNNILYVYEWINNQWVETQLTIESDVYVSFNASIYNNYLAISSNDQVYIYSKTNDVWEATSQSVNLDNYPISFHSFGLKMYEDEVVFDIVIEDNLGKIASYSGFKDIENFAFEPQYFISPTGTSAADYLGTSVAINEDFAMSGAVGFDNAEGAVYTYRRNENNTWDNTNLLTVPSGLAYDQFGSSLATDGKYLAVGAIGFPNGQYNGKVYTYQRSGENWVNLMPITAPNGISADYFGHAIAMNDNYLVIGAPASPPEQGPYNYPASQKSGSVYVYLRNKSQWDFLEEIQIVGETTPIHFGYSVSLTDDNIIFVGAPWEEEKKGKVYTYEITAAENTSPTISLQQVIEAEDATAGDKFGIALSADENQLLIGATQDENNSNTEGKAYVYEKTNTTWLLKSTIVASAPQSNTNFGSQVAILDNIASIGANKKDLLGEDSGAVYVFKKNGDNWIEKEILNASDGNMGSQFGTAIAINKGINRDILIGASNKENSVGGAYVFYTECVCADNNLVDEIAPIISFHPDRYWNPEKNSEFKISNDTLVVFEECFDIVQSFTPQDILVVDSCSYTIEMTFEDYLQADYSSADFDDYYLDRAAKVIWEATDLCGNTTLMELVVEVQSRRCVKADCSIFNDYEILVGQATRNCQNGSSKTRFRRVRRKSINNDPLCTFTGEIICENNNEVVHEVAVYITSCQDPNDPALADCNDTTPQDCNTLFTDEAGNNNYGNDEVQNYIFCPTNPDIEVIEAVFTTFEVEENIFSGGCYDFLEIFDGKDVFATSLGQFCGTSITNLPNGGIIRATNTTGCLSFLFSSDESVDLSGWNADINCVAKSNPINIDEPSKLNTTLSASYINKNEQEDDFQFAEIVAFPNPSKDRVSLQYTLRNDSNISLELIDMTGQTIKPIVHQTFKTQGKHIARLDTSPFLSGIYFIVLQGDNFYTQEKLIIIRE